MASPRFCVNALAANTPAQNYPAKPVRYVMPSTGASEVVGRLLAQGMSEAPGQQVFVDVRTGAGGNIGAEIAAKRPRTVEQVPRALERGCDPVAGCKRRT